MTNIPNTECANRWSGVSGAAINNGHICPFEPNKSACNVRIQSPSQQQAISLKDVIIQKNNICNQGTTLSI